MKRVAVLVLVSLAGLTFGACDKQEPIVTNPNGATINGVSPGHINNGDPTILEDQRAFYEKHVLPVAPPSTAPAATEATADATTAPATTTATAPATQPQ